MVFFSILEFDGMWSTGIRKLMYRVRTSQTDDKHSQWRLIDKYDRNGKKFFELLDVLFLVVFLSEVF